MSGLLTDVVAFVMDSTDSFVIGFLTAGGATIPVAGYAPTPGALTLSGVPITAGTTSSYPSFTMTASGGTAPYTWSITGEPSGMSISSSGVVTYPSPTIGTYTGIDIRVTDSASTPAHVDVTFGVVISAPTALAIAGTPTTTGTTGGGYTSFTATASGGEAPYVFSLVNAPTGMVVNSSTGVVSWPSPTAGTYSGIEVVVTDALSATAHETFGVTITSTSQADTLPKFGVAPAASTFNGAAVFAALSDITTGSTAGGKTGTFTIPITTSGQFGWVAVIASNTAVTFTDSSGAVGGWSGAASGSANYSGADTTPTTVSETWTDTSTGLTWRFFRENYVDAHSSAAYQFTIS